jgi:hypothetical protein
VGCCDQEIALPSLGYKKPVKACQNCRKKFAPPREKLKEISIAILKMDREDIASIKKEMSAIYTSSEEERTKLEKHLRDCEEILMQQLLLVDGTEVPQKLRKRKKELILHIQNLLTDIDSAKNKLYELFSSGNILVRNSPLRSPTNYDYKSGLKLVCFDPPSEDRYPPCLCLSSPKYQDNS